MNSEGSKHKGRSSIEHKIDRALDPLTVDLPFENEAAEDFAAAEYEEEAPEYEDEDVEYEDEDSDYGTEEPDYDEDTDYEDVEYEDEDSDYDEDTEYEDEESDYDENVEYEDEEPDYGESEEAYGNEAPDYGENPQSGRSSHGGAAKSARPGKIAYVPVSDEELSSAGRPQRRRKKHKGLKVFGIFVVMLFVSAGSAYGAVSYYYSSHFFRGTVINGIDCSGKTAYEVEQIFADQVEDYSIQILSRNLDPQSISGSSINYQYAASGEVLQLLKSQKPYEWIQGFSKDTSYTVQTGVTYDKTMLQEQVKALNCAQAENQVKAEDAYVALNGSEFQIVPETQGSELKVKEAYKVVDAAIAAG